ncbi:hypothetical protein Goshw_016877 [Gossypium schwendimanii]|uniref:SBP-type domain-containing protein n=1 Tax=Gossypium schwendimanii TaxID=34291 RepID=A0A7J9LWH5_GOSSC|nr:hypothetical protein [Gossypium schwendimanii]
MESSSSASFKRARAPATGNQVPSCLVDGCTADLSKCRDYHRRHKVCEVHSKTPKVTIRGQEQRFCQQCSRFHSLVEFDEVKRSCRKRLDGHNRRRRKPQPDFMSVNSGRFPYNHQGTRYFPIGSSQMHSWMGGVKVESDMKLINFSGGNSLFPGFSSDNHHKGEKHFPFLQTTASSHPGSGSLCQPFLDASSSGDNSRKMFSDELNQAIDSDRALSLLSSQPAENWEIGLSPMVQPASASFVISNLQFNDVGGMGGEPVGTAILDADGGGNNSHLQGHEMFQNEHLGSSATGGHHTLSFSWE